MKYNAKNDFKIWIFNSANKTTQGLHFEIPFNQRCMWVNPHIKLLPRVKLCVTLSYNFTFSYFQLYHVIKRWWIASYVEPTSYTTSQVPGKGGRPWPRAWQNSPLWILHHCSCLWFIIVVQVVQFFFFFVVVVVGVKTGSTGLAWSVPRSWAPGSQQMSRQGRPRECPLDDLTGPKRCAFAFSRPTPGMNDIDPFFFSWQ